MLIQLHVIAFTSTITGLMVFNVPAGALYGTYEAFRYKVRCRKLSGFCQELSTSVDL